MTDAEKVKLSKETILHVITAIANDERKYWLMGEGTESWHKLTKAAAELWGEPVEEIKKNFTPHPGRYARYCSEVEENDRLLRYCRENGITGKEAA